MTMRITYYALRPVLVGDETRIPGDLIPEAQDWPYLSGYLGDGKIAPVLVATLPREQQEMLLEWEQEVYGATAVQQVVEGPAVPAEEIDKTDPDVDADEGVPLVTVVDEPEDAVTLPPSVKPRKTEKVT